MDLVKAYDSEMDDSDIEEINVQNSGTMEAPKKVDLIELLSDSEDESAVEKNNIPLTATNQKTSGSSSNQEIDCIDLEMSDSPIKDSQTNKTSDVASNSATKIDYLNLEETESDIECENSDKTIHTLMETASVLGDKPSGPQKPSDVPECSDYVTEGKSIEKELEKAALSNIGIDNHSSARNTPDFIHSNTSHDSNDNSLLEPPAKHFKGDSSMVTSNIPDDVIDNNLSCIFRDDDNVTEASKKNVMCRIPRQIIQTHNAHSSIITSLSWCIPKFSYLFLSAARDGSLKIWDLYRKNSVQCIKATSGFYAAKWSLDGGQIIAGGSGKKAFVYDVQTGKRIVEYDIYNVITSIEVHPYLEDVFLCGTRNAILGFDIRVNTTFPIRSYFSNCEEVLDIAFLDENEFICSTNIVSHDSADRTIMAWDFSSGAILSNQIYSEHYTCPSLKVHPFDSSFIAQTNGNYISVFSTSRPYKMDQKRRYTGHKVAGFGIECDISPDGKYVVSGDAAGSVHFYNYSTTNTVLVTPPQKAPINRVKWHPAFSSILISASYDGQIQIWK